jgi:hypothetical protein
MKYEINIYDDINNNKKINLEIFYKEYLKDFMNNNMIVGSEWHDEDFFKIRKVNCENNN